MNKYISICRNPYGFSVHEQRNARISLCCEVERLRARVAELETMVKVFRGCIDTQVFPAKDSRCHRFVHDLVGVYKSEKAGGTDA